MRKRVLLTVFALFLIAFTVNIASAQFPNPHPFIAVYFDDNYQIMAKPCPGAGVVQNLYVVLVNANAFVSGVEYSISYPPEILWLADMCMPPVTIGLTTTGVSMGFGGTPQNGYPGPGRPHGGILVGCPLVQWLCDTCEPQNLNSQIKVGKHPLSPSAYPRFTDFPYYILHDAIGMTSLICATIPTEESTWGKVKALYSE